MVHSFEVERYCIASALRHPAIIADISHLVKEDDFVSPLNRVIYGALVGFINSGQDINVFALAERISNTGITFEEELEGNLLDYLQELKLIMLTEHGGIEQFKELKKLSVRREIISGARLIIKEMEGAKDASIEEIISLADRAYATKIASFESAAAKDFEDIYADLEEIIEERGNNPLTEFGLMGPFKRVNEIYGSLLRPGNITLIGARQNVGKSSLGHFYLTDVSERYKVPILHLDAGEMTKFEFQLRTVVMLTHGKVPMYYIETGQWRQSEEMVRLVRAAWKRIQAADFHCHYKNIGGLSPQEICSVIRRFSIAKVGRGKPFVGHYDYLKSFENFGVDSPEWQQMGYFIQMLKTLITMDGGVPIPIWTSLQLNKAGIVGNKHSALVDDTESTFSISDRIIHQVTHAFILRKKTQDELLEWPNFGNCNFINVKKRHLGEDWQAAVNPVRMSDGSLKDNYMHIQAESFVFKEMGDLSQNAHKQGQLMNKPKNDDDEPADVPRGLNFDESDLVLQ